jgi:hypothetical protein
VHGVHEPAAAAGHGPIPQSDEVGLPRRRGQPGVQDCTEIGGALSCARRAGPSVTPTESRVAEIAPSRCTRYHNFILSRRGWRQPAGSRCSGCSPNPGMVTSGIFPDHRSQGDRGVAVVGRAAGATAHPRQPVALASAARGECPCAPAPPPAPPLLSAGRDRARPSGSAYPSAACGVNSGQTTSTGTSRAAAMRAHTAVLGR